MERWGRTKGNWHFLPLRLRLLQSLSEPQPIRTCPWNFALIRPVSRSSTWQGCAVQPRGAKTAANFSAGIAACSLGGNILPPLMEWPWKSGKNGVFDVQSVLGLFSGGRGPTGMCWPRLVQPYLISGTAGSTGRANPAHLPAQCSTPPAQRSLLSRFFSFYGFNFQHN